MSPPPKPYWDEGVDNTETYSTIQYGDAPNKIQIKTTPTKQKIKPITTTIQTSNEFRPQCQTQVHTKTTMAAPNPYNIRAHANQAKDLELTTQHDG